MYLIEQLLIGILLILLSVYFYIVIGWLVSRWYLWHYTQHFECVDAWRLGIERHKLPQDRNYLRAKTAFNLIQKKHSWAERFHAEDKIVRYWPLVLLWYKRGKGVTYNWY